MALKRRDGFVYTLEAILASTLVLGIVLTVIPELQQNTDTIPQEQVRSGLQTLDRTGELTDELLAEEMESELEPYIPSAYNYSVNIVRTRSSSDSVSAPYKHYIETSGNHSEIQLWIKSANGLNVSFGGETLVEDYSRNGYKTVPTSASEGWLNFTGSAELDYKFSSHSSNTESLSQDQVSVISYVVLKNGTKEIQVRLWN